jgi:hypothetical protein
MCICVYLRESAANHKISFQPYRLEQIYREPGARLLTGDRLYWKTREQCQSHAVTALPFIV